MVDVSYQGPTYSLNLFGRESQDYEFAGFVKDVTCYNQGEYVQYSLVAAEFHKCMKTALMEGDTSTALECRRYLLDFLNRNLDRIINRNFECLRAHFKRRAKSLPRICVKGGFSLSSRESVVSLFRDSNVNYVSDCYIEDNTGFKFIYDTGRPYCCNNIPGKAKIGEYRNPRLNPEAAKLYKEAGFVKRKLGLDKGEDEEWVRCWNSDNGRNITSDSCYKSTLIVPMTLWNNSLDDTFKELINISDVGRTIFGFLCADHIDRDYFIPDIDIRVGYFFADLLSLYFISRLVYTEISDTFKSFGEIEEGD